MRSYRMKNKAIQIFDISCPNKLTSAFEGWSKLGELSNLLSTLACISKSPALWIFILILTISGGVTILILRF